MKVQRYAEAKLVDLLRVVEAAESLYSTVAEYPDDPACWEEEMNYLDIALESCPGTTAFLLKHNRPTDWETE